MICLLVSLSLVMSYVSPTFAASKATPAISSSPSTGPAGAVISVSGSGWFVPDGTPVTFGFVIVSGCGAVQDEQPGTVKAGSFSGWFRWPANSGLGTFTVCAIMEVDPFIPIHSYTVLSLTPPQISLSASTLSAGKAVTVRGTNYLPPGSSVQLLWQPVHGGNSTPLASVVSDSNGAFTHTFTVPATTQPGAYMLSASVGSGNGGQPATLSASVTLRVNSFTPPIGATPVSNPTPTPAPRPTATASVSATPSATPTATMRASATPGATARPGRGQSGQGNRPDQGDQARQPASTRHTVGTASNTGGFTNPRTLFTIAGMAGFLVSATVLGVVLVMRRKRGAGKTGTTVAQAAANLATAGSGYAPRYAGQPGMENQSAPPLAGWVPTPMPAPGQPNAMLNGAPRPATAEIFIQPHDQLAYPQSGGVASLAGKRADPAADLVQLIQSDPDLEAVMRQAQAGLFAMPR